MMRGEIWWVDFGIPVGSLAAYRRPVIVMQNESDLNTIVVVPLTANLAAAEYKPNVFFSKADTALSKDCVAVIHLIGAVNKFCFIEKISAISDSMYKSLVRAVNDFIC